MICRARSRKSGRTIDDCPIPPEALDELVNLIDERQDQRQTGEGSFRGDVREREIGGGDRAGEGDRAAERHRRDRSALRAGDRGESEAGGGFPSGQAASLNFLKGQVMKLSQGKANPALVGEILERKLRG